jgi:hypothetical protein
MQSSAYANTSMSDLFNQYSKIERKSGVSSEINQSINPVVKHDLVILKDDVYGFIEQSFSELDIHVGGGLNQTYRASYDEVWSTVISTIKGTKLHIINKNKESGKIFAKQNASAWSYGENVGFFIRPIESDSSNVEVVSKKVMSSNLFATDWESEILGLLNNLLGKSASHD